MLPTKEIFKKFEKFLSAIGCPQNKVKRSLALLQRANKGTSRTVSENFVFFFAPSCRAGSKTYCQFLAFLALTPISKSYRGPKLDRLSIVAQLIKEKNETPFLFISFPLLFQCWLKKEKMRRGKKRNRRIYPLFASPNAN